MNNHRPDRLRTRQIAAGFAALALAILVAGGGGSSSGNTVSHSHAATRASLDGRSLISAAQAAK